MQGLRKAQALALQQARARAQARGAHGKAARGVQAKATVLRWVEDGA